MKAVVLEILITSSVLITGIFGLRKLTMGKISMRLRYGLWLLVAVRLLMPVSLGTSPVSVMNFFSEIRQMGAVPRDVAQEDAGLENAAQGDDGIRGMQGKEAGGGTDFGMRNPAQDTEGQNPDITSVMDGASAGQTGFSDSTDSVYGENLPPATRMIHILAAVWFAGFLAVGGYLFFQRYRFVRYLRRRRKEMSGDGIPAAVREKLSERGMYVYRVKGLPSPCLVGRRIYIGEQTPGKEQGLTHVLAHEYCHRVHGDGFWAFLRCALAALYWFDPLVWAAAFAARQDSDLACDEAAVRLLGEEERFAYGRTLLALLPKSGGVMECPGMPLMFSGSEHSVRERIVALTEKKKAEGVVLVAVFSMVLLVCGCAFTGAADQGAKEERSEEMATAENSAGEQKAEETSPAPDQTMVSEEKNGETARIQEESAKQDAFAEALADYDDSGLSEDRQVDVQHFYEYGTGKREDAPEEGWYLLCRNEEEAISCYGLYTEGFGCRGVKTLIGEDVNAFDLVWYPCHVNKDSQNIKVLERAQDGLPRRFVWKYMEEESSVVEIWRLAAGFRYDTGTVDMKVLPKEDYLSWADWHLTFGVDQEKGQALVYYDGAENGLVGVLDISGYQDFEVEEVQICTDTVAFELDSKVDAEEAGEDFEGVVIHLAPGLKLKGHEGLWLDGLSPLAVELLWDEEEDGGFRFGQPTVDEQLVCHSLVQERKLQNIREGKAPENGQAGNDAAADGQDGDSAAGDTLAEPLVNGTENIHDLVMIFGNPCPDCDRISDRYGERVHPVTGETVTHNGVDLAAPAGTDIVAAAEGTVYRVGFDTVNGNYVVLWHGQSGQMTYYAHCRETLVEEGDWVAAGQKIAAVGQTGQATGPHLHFAVSYETEWQEPVWEDME